MRRIAIAFGLVLALSASAQAAPKSALIFAAKPLIDCNFAAATPTTATPPTIGPNCPSFSASRSSTGTYFSPSGLLTTALANVPRLDTNPATLTRLGMLSEAPATNLVSQNRTFGSSWGKSNATVTANNQTGIDGVANSASTVTDTTFSGEQIFYYNTQIGTANVVNAYEGVAKKGTRNFLAVDYQGNTNNFFTVIFDLSAGAVGETHTSTGGTIVGTPTIVPLGGGWYHVTLVGSSTFGPGFFQFGFATAASGNSYHTDGMPVTTGTGSGTILIDFAQLEVGSFQTSPIATTSAAVTRAGDAASQSIAPLNLQTGFSWVISGTTAPGLSGTQVMGQIDDGSANNRMTVQRSSSAHLQVVIVSGGTTQATLDLGVVANSSFLRVGINMNAGQFAATLNGGAFVTGSGSMPASLTTARYGNDITGDQWGGWIARDTKWRFAGTKTQARALTGAY